MRYTVDTVVVRPFNHQNELCPIGALWRQPTGGPLGGPTGAALL